MGSIEKVLQICKTFSGRDPLLTVACNAPLGGALQCKDHLLLHCRWKVHKHKMTFVVQVILAALIDNPHQLISGRSRIGKNPIDLAGDQGRLIAGVVDTKSERFRRG